MIHWKGFERCDVEGGGSNFCSFLSPWGCLSTMEGWGGRGEQGRGWRGGQRREEGVEQKGAEGRGRRAGERVEGRRE